MERLPVVDLVAVILLSRAENHALDLLWAASRYVFVLDVITGVRGALSMSSGHTGVSCGVAKLLDCIIAARAQKRVA